MKRNGKSKGVPSCRKPGTRNIMSLVPGVAVESPETRAEAFIGRMMTVNDGEAYDLLAQPYCEESNGYDLMNRAIKSMYKRYVVNAGWREAEFFKALGWIMTCKMQIDSYSFDRAARMAEQGRLPLGDLQYLSVSSFNAIAIN